MPQRVRRKHSAMQRPMQNEPVEEVKTGSHVADSVETQCPQPRHALPAALFPANAGNPSGGRVGNYFTEVLNSPHSTGGDEASNELRDVLFGGGGAGDGRFKLADVAEKKGCTPVVRPLSSISTCAGPTPTPEDRANTPVS